VTAAGTTRRRRARNGPAVSRKADGGSDHPRELVDRYAAAFRSYLSEPAEFALARAYELGRRALADGLGVLEMASVHSAALTIALERPLPDGGRARVLEASDQFFVEALSPFEMAHRGFREANDVLRRLNDVLEAQNKRIAYALHDEAAQLLVPLHLGLAEVARKVPAEVANELKVTRSLLDAIEERLRHLSHELRPPSLDHFGLVPALEFLSSSVSKRWGLPVTLHASVDGSLPATVETTLYRITQEALTNVAKHAQATTAQVSLRRVPHAVVCSVCDNGIGFEAVAAAGHVGRPGLGLAGIRERVTALGGTVRLGPNEGGGTNLTVEIPLERRTWA
jgi:signal transduction histidine kinase